ncbi:MAG TPA: hypothetical protein VM324_16400 [Egibacteraceae bacterium]|jgi:hypothetical protein|nr:hypothetical protein [Egibacteraceae bacterium]
MIDTDRLDELLRAADPAADIDRSPHTPTATRLRERARHMSRVPVRPRPHSPLRPAGVVAATFFLLGGAVALAAGVFQPNPEHVTTILAEAEEAGRYAFKNEGWRPTLRSEEIWCVAEDGTVGSGRSYEFTLDAEMTEDDLLAACRDGSDGVRGLEVGAATYTLCEGVADSNSVRALLDEPQFAVRVIDGSITGDRPGFPVVLGWQADCAHTALDTTLPVTLRPLSSLAAVNRAREVEIGLTAAALDSCLTAAQAETLAEQARDELHHDWLIVEAAHDPSLDFCRRVWLEADYGILLIGPAH